MEQVWLDLLTGETEAVDGPFLLELAFKSSRLSGYLSFAYGAYGIPEKHDLYGLVVKMLKEEKVPRKEFTWGPISPKTFLRLYDLLREKGSLWWAEIWEYRNGEKERKIIECKVDYRNREEVMRVVRRTLESWANNSE